MIVDGVTIEIRRTGDMAVLLLQAKPFGHKIVMPVAQARQLIREFTESLAPTYYEILGVARTATTADIKKAFRNKAKRHHPDQNGEHAEMTKVNEAYAVLSDVEQRQQYDSLTM